MPRCSMNSFSQRNEAEVVDEPLYAAYLKARPHQKRPYKDPFLLQASKSKSDENAFVVEKIMERSSLNKNDVRFFF